MPQSLYDKIYELQGINVLSKHEHLVNGIINAIEARILKKGDQLPSINKMVEELGYARKTIVKAYEDLKGRGIVESKNFKGYYISSEETKQVLKVALVLFAFHSFQEAFYNTFRKCLDENMQLDVFFHHNNFNTFQKILADAESKYGMLVVAPVQDDKSLAVLKNISPSKLLLIDRFIPMGDEYSHIVQEFVNNTFSKLTMLKDSFNKYEKLILLYDEETDHPEGVKDGVVKFCKEYEINLGIEKEYKSKSLKKGEAYITISDSGLWEILKDCQENAYTLGEDIGVIAHNDNPMKEIVFGGITTISTDFKEMALKASDFVKFKKNTQINMETTLFKRNSF
ncbi:MAG: GntR family transcriptional regulator [Cyclobacteriaceae bacterium]